MKPNLNTLVLIDILSLRYEYLERIITCHNIQESVIITTAIQKQNDTIAKIESPIKDIVNENKTKTAKKIVVRSINSRKVIDKNSS
jgi:hypothetical protein